MFMIVDKQKLQTEQANEYGRLVQYVLDENAPILEIETWASMLCYSVRDCMLFKSHTPGHLRKRGTYLDQFAPTYPPVGLDLPSYHDHALSGGHLALQSTYENIRQTYWWPNISKNVHRWRIDYQACQRRKTTHNCLKLPTGHVPVKRPFQRESGVLFKYKMNSNSSAGVPHEIYDIRDGPFHGRCTVLVPNKSAVIVAKCWPTEFSQHSAHQKSCTLIKTELDNCLVSQLQTLLKCEKTRTKPFRPKGNLVVSERVRSNLHATLATRSSAEQDNWATMLSLAQMVYNISYVQYTTVQNRASKRCEVRTVLRQTRAGGKMRSPAGGPPEGPRGGAPRSGKKWPFPFQETLQISQNVHG